MINQTECCQPSSYKESSFPPLWRDFWACCHLFTLNRSPNLSWLSKDCKVMRAAFCSKGPREMLEKTDFVNLGLVFVKDLVRPQVIRWRVPPLVVQSGCKRAATLDWKPVNVCGMTVVKNAQMLIQCWLFSWVLSCIKTRWKWVFSVLPGVLPCVISVTNEIIFQQDGYLQ